MPFAPRKTVALKSWPDPLIQERLEDIGFFFDTPAHTWIRFCDDSEIQSLGDWLKRHQLNFAITPARGRGELKKHPKLSDILLLKTGGNASTCALCGAHGIPCRQWIEGDDTDSTDYPGAARFYLCGQCVQNHMHPHPRLYAPADDQL